MGIVDEESRCSCCLSNNDNDNVKLIARSNLFVNVCPGVLVPVISPILVILVFECNINFKLTLAYVSNKGRARGTSEAKRLTDAIQ